MSDQLNEILGNLRNSSYWIRILLMIAFAALLYLIIAPVALMIMIAQMIFTFATGSLNANLSDFGRVLTEYILQILKYLLFNSEDKPFPFSRFSAFENPYEDDSDNSRLANKKKAPAKKAPAKKAPAKKAPAKKAPTKRAKADTSSNDNSENDKTS